jgi:DNA-binding MarR family transcriptional regulator
MKDETLRSHAYDLENRIFYRFSLLVGEHVRHFSKHHIRKYKLSTQNWLILTVIGRFAPLAPSELAEHTSVSRDKITRILDQLVEQGMVSRKTDEADRRRVVLSLLSKGKRACEELEMIARRVEADVLEGLSASERQQFFDLLTKIERRAKEALPE